MKHLSPFVALLFAITLCLTACSDGTTDDPLPEGTAPNAPAQADAEQSEASGTTDPDTADPPAQPADDAGGDALGAADSTADPTAEPETASADRQSAKGFTYVMPEGWSVKPSSSSMRALTLVPPADEFPGAELAVFFWPNRVGGFAGNVSRWAQQAGTTPPSLKRADYEQLNVSGTESAYIAMANKDIDKAILAVWVPLGDDPDAEGPTWTPKLTCTAEQALKLEAPFKAWAASVKFE